MSRLDKKRNSVDEEIRLKSRNKTRYTKTYMMQKSYEDKCDFAFSSCCSKSMKTCNYNKKHVEMKQRNAGSVTEEKAKDEMRRTLRNRRQEGTYEVCVL